MRAKDAVGRYGEDVAARALTDAGLHIVERNWRCRDGELDIVARDGDVLVICEVKTRSGLGYGHPAEAVTRTKAVRLRRLARIWLADRRPPWVREVRFDVIAVLRPRRGAAQVEHLREVL